MILKEKHTHEDFGALAFSKFMRCPFPPSGYLYVPLGQVEIAGFTIRASSETEGDEIFLHNPLDADRRYVAVVVANGWVSVHGWILGQDAIRLGRSSETEWGGVWVKAADLSRKFSR
jgi:hypothetical protein